MVTNRVSAVLVNLPVSEPDPGQRLALIREQMDSFKRTSQATSAELLTGMAGFTGPLWLALGSRAATELPQSRLQTVITDVPGPRTPLYILGRRMEADYPCVYPYVPIGNRVRISFAIFSYLDTFSFGLTADHRAHPGPEDLAAMGVNPMDARRREAVLDSALRTSPASLARPASWPRCPADHPSCARSGPGPAKIGGCG